MKRWNVSQSSFDGFLATLSPDRDAAGREYEELRARVKKYFEWRACNDADSLADETFDRVMRRVSDGEMIVDMPKYVCGVARYIWLEYSKKCRRDVPLESLDTYLASRESEADDAGLECLERCLPKITEQSRKIILEYYSFDKQAKIDHRSRLALELGITVNTLRIRALRIRNKIENCVTECLDSGK